MGMIPKLVLKVNGVEAALGASLSGAIRKREEHNSGLTSSPPIRKHDGEKD